ncbi:transposase [Peribacillus tepidiphilus]|uniref:transposase n=1 Tax=Peribacillus tepidiphilus TaxID=2652445 RepID=UPI0021F082DD|nr:transposase [Peribacillus tepidiphilus]
MKYIQTDIDAVKHALSHSWSNGIVEGQVNRLKVIKRQMYGRAKLDLLEKKVLYQRT